MLTTNVRFEGWTVTDWDRFLELFKAPPAQASSFSGAPSPEGGIIVVHDGNRVLKLLHTGRGRIEPDAAWPIPLSELARTHNARFAVSLYFGALDEVMERFGARVYRGDSITEQSIALLHVFREMMMEGVIETWPDRLRSFPVPAPDMVNRALDAFTPPGHSFVLGAFDKGELWTACVLHRTDRGFDVVAGPDELRPQLGLLSGEFRRDYRHLAHAAESKYGPVGFGFYAEKETLKRLTADNRPGAWARAAMVREIVLSPIPFGIGFAVGLDVARVVVQHVARAISGSPLGATIDPLFARVQRGVGTITGADVLTALGFDPLSALRALRGR